MGNGKYGFYFTSTAGKSRHFSFLIGREDVSPDIHFYYPATVLLILRVGEVRHLILAHECFDNV